MPGIGDFLRRAGAVVVNALSRVEEQVPEHQIATMPPAAQDGGEAAPPPVADEFVPPDTAAAPRPDVSAQPADRAAAARLAGGLPEAERPRVTPEKLKIYIETKVPGSLLNTSELGSPTEWIAQFVIDHWSPQTIAVAETAADVVTRRYFRYTATLRDMGMTSTGADTHRIVRKAIENAGFPAAAESASVQGVSGVDIDEPLQRAIDAHRGQIQQKLARYIHDTGGLDGTNIAPDSVSDWLSGFIVQRFSPMTTGKAEELGGEVIDWYRGTLNALRAFGLHRRSRTTHELIRKRLEAMERSELKDVFADALGSIPAEEIDRILGDRWTAWSKDLGERTRLPSGVDEGLLATPVFSFVLWGRKPETLAAARAEVSAFNDAAAELERFIAGLGFPDRDVRNLFAVSAINGVLDIDDARTITAARLVEAATADIDREIAQLESMNPADRVRFSRDLGPNHLINCNTLYRMLLAARAKISGGKGGSGSSGGGTTSTGGGSGSTGTGGATSSAAGIGGIVDLSGGDSSAGAAPSSAFPSPQGITMGYQLGGGFGVFAQPQTAFPVVAVVPTMTPMMR